MITATPRPAPPSFVRSAREADAPALTALSEPFARSGALRARPASLYAARAADFLVLQAPDGELEGCVGLSIHASGPAPDSASSLALGSASGPAPSSVAGFASGPLLGSVPGPASGPSSGGPARGLAENRGLAGVLYNFCVAGRRQGHGVGTQLLHAAVHMARAQSLDALFTATTGDGNVFVRHGFTPISERLAPPSWAKSLDPRRNAQVFARAL
ncbi:GNAT family N-acetyltransferase [Streptomyces alfalfae]|uniref:GNAT family N-acetyltransferase n=1 Tax=Streptomyces alfalfae TaxID=1642299 RepID=UPI001E33332F|nr:GNAT family N-acetyltransferase [Streptomyces alfalfae]